jgi:hypothetical protein
MPPLDLPDDHGDSQRASAFPAGLLITPVKGRAIPGFKELFGEGAGGFARLRPPTFLMSKAVPKEPFSPLKQQT